MPSSPNDRRLSRRQFHCRAVQTAAALIVSAAAGGAQEPADPVPASPPAPETPTELERAVQDVLAQAPHFPLEDRAELATQVKGVLDLATALRGHNVPEGAEPAFVFQAVPPSNGGSGRG